MTNNLKNIKIGERQLYYLDQGDGHPVIFIMVDSMIIDVGSFR